MTSYKIFAPGLVLPTVQHGTFDLAAERGRPGHVVFFYRGLHCEASIKLLTELMSHVSAFEELGFGVVAVSRDNKDRAVTMVERLRKPDLRIAYDLTQATAQAWDLGSSNIKALPFVEPAVFVLNSDQTLLYASTDLGVFAEPRFSEIRDALESFLDQDKSPLEHVNYNIDFMRYYASTYL